MRKSKVEVKVGDVFNKWTAIEILGGVRSLVKVRCVCGTERVFRRYQLVSDISMQCRTCANKSRMRINIGDVFDKLTVVAFTESDNNSRRVAICKCVCGSIKKTLPGELQRNKANHCGCSRQSNWQGVGDLSQSYVNRILHGARKRGLLFEITIEEVWELFQKQNSLCALSSMPIRFGQRDTDKNTASLDRIDSSIGYILSNVQWVHKDVNKMKNNISEERLIELCKLIVDNNSMRV